MKKDWKNEGGEREREWLQRKLGGREKNKERKKERER